MEWNGEKGLIVTQAYFGLVTCVNKSLLVKLDCFEKNIKSNPEYIAVDNVEVKKRMHVDKIKMKVRVLF